MKEAPFPGDGLGKGKNPSRPRGIRGLCVLVMAIPRLVTPEGKVFSHLRSPGH